MDILAEANDAITRRVTPDGAGGYTGGYQPVPMDPNTPEDPKRLAMRQARAQAEQALNAWFATRPVRADGQLMLGNLKQADVERVLAGEDPNTIILGRSSSGAFGADPSQYRALAQQYLAWLAKRPPAFNRDDPKWD
jgi:hypothetical protein